MKIYNDDAFRDPPHCVLLDLDNTLYDYAACNRAGMTAARALAQQLLNIGATDFDNCFADARLELKSRLGPTGASHSRILYFQRTVERAGFASQPFASLQLEQAYWRAYLDAAVLFEEVLEFLNDLRIASVPVVPVTDLTAQIQLRKLTVLGLDSLIDWIVTSEESGRDKPHPASFELALAKIGGVEGRIWMIGDDPKCDLAGAREAVGATTLLKLAPGEKPAAKVGVADVAFDHFGSIRTLVRRTLESARVKS